MRSQRVRRLECRHRSHHLLSTGIDEKRLIARASHSIRVLAMVVSEEVTESEDKAVYAYRLFTFRLISFTLTQHKPKPMTV